MDWSGRRVTVMGLGRHGGAIGVVRFLHARGANITVTDQADESSLSGSLEKLSDLPGIRFALCGHRDTVFRNADFVVVNPAVRPDNYWLHLAREQGAVVTTEIELLLAEAKPHVAAITGSNGKSTTAAMLYEILRADGEKTWLGGNLGGSLLEQVELMDTDDWIVLELSSFQLHRLPATIRPFDVSIVTSLTANHLDWHRDLDHYVRSKQRIVELTAPHGSVVLNLDDVEVRTWDKLAAGKSVKGPVATESIPTLQVPGIHNRTNARLAAAAGGAIGCSAESVFTGLSQYKGLSHRLEFVTEFAGRRFADDSASTTPESTIAAIHAMQTPVWLLVGGSDKGSDFHTLSESFSNYVQGVACFGEVGPKIDRACETNESRCARCVVSTLDEALQWCWQRSQVGDTILLSPACASSDQFDNYVHRAEVFRQLIASLNASKNERKLASNFLFG